MEPPLPPLSRLRSVVALLLLCALSACGGGPRGLALGGHGDYRAPGPPRDPWGPYVRQASARFDVPQTWIRAVMRQESGGHEYLHGRPITSDAGAMGLMQLMPATYAELRDRYGLGNDPYDPHDNIMAGTGYIRQLYGRYGSPAFLAAYDAGPQRVDDYMAGRSRLPNETVNYLASVAPLLGPDRPMSGPLAVYAQGGYAQGGGAQGRYAYTPPRRYAARRCWQDPDAAYDPTAPCRPAPPRAAPVEVAAAMPAPTPWGQGSPQGSPQGSSQGSPVSPAPRRGLGNFLIPSAEAATIAPGPTMDGWAIQVGAFASADQAREVADGARGLAPLLLARAQTMLGPTTAFGGKVLYRARLLGLSERDAAAACRDLADRRQACVAVPPGG